MSPKHTNKVNVSTILLLLTFAAITSCQAAGLTTVSSPDADHLVVPMTVDSGVINVVGKRYLGLGGGGSDNLYRGDNRRHSRNLDEIAEGYEYLGHLHAAKWHEAIDLLQTSETHEIQLQGLVEGTMHTRTITSIGKQYLRRQTISDYDRGGRLGSDEDVTTFDIYDDVTAEEEIDNTFRVVCVAKDDPKYSAEHTVCSVYCDGHYEPTAEDIVARTRLLTAVSEMSTSFLLPDVVTNLASVPAYLYKINSNDHVEYTDASQYHCTTHSDCEDVPWGLNYCVCQTVRKAYKKGESCKKTLGCYECDDEYCDGCTAKRFCSKRDEICPRSCFSPTMSVQVCPTTTPTTTTTSSTTSSSDEHYDGVGVDLVATKTMNELKVGDYVLTGKGTCEQVYTMYHWDKEEPTEYLQISTATTTKPDPTATNDVIEHIIDDDHDDPIELTGNHLIYLYDKSQPPVPASDISVGDVLVDVHGQPRVVVDIRTIVRNGYYAPLTTDGTIVVNGIVSSTYISASSKQYLTIGNTDIISYHDLLHGLVTPFRFLCSMDYSIIRTSNVCETMFMVNTETGGTFIGNSVAEWYHDYLVMNDETPILQWIMLLISPLVLPLNVIVHTAAAAAAAATLNLGWVNFFFKTTSISLFIVIAGIPSSLRMVSKK